jgi:hypothetical protein
MSRGRGLKIHHRQRLSKKRRFRFGRDLLKNPKELAKTISTPTPCSCWMCGNHRKFHGLTMQERRMLPLYSGFDKSLELISNKA